MVKVEQLVNIQFLQKCDRKTIVRLIVGLICALGIKNDVLKILRGY